MYIYIYIYVYIYILPADCCLQPSARTNEVLSFSLWMSALTGIARMGGRQEGRGGMREVRGWS